jgi:hypothetical protein
VFKVIRWAIIYLRLSLGLTFLSACRPLRTLAPGSRYAVWGDWSHFAAYAAKLNSFLPVWLHIPAACIATIAEISFGFALISGLFVRQAAYGSAALLGSLALAMTIFLEIKAPLNYSVFVGAGAAWLLAVMLDQEHEFTSRGRVVSQATQEETGLPVGATSTATHQFNQKPAKSRLSMGIPEVGSTFNEARCLK